ncbi:MAG: hypothetical protein R2757_12280 [Draconibacterium sp.]
MAKVTMPIVPKSALSVEDIFKEYHQNQVAHHAGCTPQTRISNYQSAGRWFTSTTA